MSSRTKNYVERGGDRMIIGGTLDRAGAPKLSSLSAMLVQRYQVAPALHTATYVHAAMNLGLAAQDVASAITQPDMPRIVTIKGGIAGQTGNVVITGTNILGASITDTIALNGTGEVAGTKAFQTVSNIHLPVQTHTATPQKETATVVAAAGITGDGDAAVVVTAAGMTGSPKTYAVAVATNDTADQVAVKIRAALSADAALTALFTVGGTGAAVTLTRNTCAANDSSLNVAIDNGTCTGLTTEASSANTTAGVAYDTVSIGIGSPIGMPHILANATMLLLYNFNGSIDTGGSLAIDATYIEKNLYTAAGTFDGAKKLELYYLV
jgi:hypothetical protein